MHTAEQISFANVHFFIGLDAHLRNWKVNIPLDRSQRRSSYDTQESRTR
jgi:hypothetical protein